MVRRQHALGDVDLPVGRHPRLGGQRTRRRRNRGPPAPCHRVLTLGPVSEHLAQRFDPRILGFGASDPGAAGAAGARSASGGSAVTAGLPPGPTLESRASLRFRSTRHLAYCVPRRAPTESPAPAPCEDAAPPARFPAASPPPDRCTRDTHPHTGTPPAAAARATAAPRADRRAARASPTPPGTLS